MDRVCATLSTQRTHIIHGLSGNKQRTSRATYVWTSGKSEMTTLTLISKTQGAQSNTSTPDLDTSNDRPPTDSIHTEQPLPIRYSNYGRVVLVALLTITA
jgi:hypothetical protein